MLNEAKESKSTVSMLYHTKGKGVHTLTGIPVRIEEKWARMAGDESKNKEGKKINVWTINTVGVKGKIEMVHKKSDGKNTDKKRRQ